MFINKILFKCINFVDQKQNVLLEHIILKAFRIYWELYWFQYINQQFIEISTDDLLDFYEEKNKFDSLHMDINDIKLIPKYNDLKSKIDSIATQILKKTTASEIDEIHKNLIQLKNNLENFRD